MNTCTGLNHHILYLSYPFQSSVINLIQFDSYFFRLRIIMGRLGLSWTKSNYDFLWLYLYTRTLINAKIDDSGGVAKEYLSFTLHVSSSWSNGTKWKQSSQYPSFRLHISNFYTEIQVYFWKIFEIEKSNSQINSHLTIDFWPTAFFHRDYKNTKLI